MKEKLTIHRWLPVIVLALVAAFAVVRMQTIQAAMVKQLDSKISSAVYQADRSSLKRELDLIHADLVRIEGKLDDVIITNPKNDPEPGRN